MIDPSAWYAKLLLATVEAELGLYEEAIGRLSDLRTIRPTDIYLDHVLSGVHLLWARSLVEQGQIASAERQLIIATELCLIIIKAGAFNIAWHTVTDIVLLRSSIRPEWSTKDDCGHCWRIIADICILPNRKLIKRLITPNIASTFLPSEGVAAMITFVTLHGLGYLISHTAQDTKLNSVAWHKLCTFLLQLSLKDGTDQMYASAVSAIKFSVFLNPENELLWISLGLLSCRSAPDLAHVRDQVDELSDIVACLYSGAGSQP